MAVDFSENFEGGSNGVAITNANSQYNGGKVGAGTVTFDNTNPAHGTLAAKFVTSANTVVLQRTFASATQRTERHLWKLTALPAANLILAVVKLGAASATATLRVTSTGTIQIRDASTTVATTTTQVAVNSYFRYEWQIDSVAATQTLKLFVSPNVDGNTPDETITGSYTGGNFDTSNAGPNTNSTTTLYLDDALEDTSITTIGPVVAATGSIFTFQHTVTIGT
jgi:hypothetical protein